VDLISKSVKQLCRVAFEQFDEECVIGDLRCHSVGRHCRVRVQFRVVLHLFHALLEVADELLPLGSDADGHRDVQAGRVLHGT